MARMIGKLTAMRVTQERRPGYHSDGGGLYLQVSPSCAKSWVFRFRDSGRLREMGLGPLHTVSLAEARQRALVCRQARLDGRDPIAERKAQRSAAAVAAKVLTFRQCGMAYIEAHRAGWKNAKHADQWTNTLETYAYTILGDVPAPGIDTGLVMRVVEPIWSTKPETASRVRGRIESILDWAKVRGYRDGENPARWRGHLDHLLPKKSMVAKAKREATGRSEHFAAMPFDDVPALMVELRKRNGISAKALEFTVLTGKRTEEILGARRREVDRNATLMIFDNNIAKTVRCPVWTIPAGRMKGAREHRVPLSDAAIAVLDAIEYPDDDMNRYIFPGNKPGEPLTNILKYLKEDMEQPAFTVHGFRSSFRDWASERTAFPNEVIEMALAHVISDKVEAAYRRGDLFEKRAQLMQAWAKFCARPAVAADNVRPIRTAG